MRACRVRKVGDTVPIDEAKRRALVYLAGLQPRDWARPSYVANAIWPNTRWRAQGAGFIGARILRLLKDDGLVRWNYHEYGAGRKRVYFDGWSITTAGRQSIK